MCVQVADDVHSENDKSITLISADPAFHKWYFINTSICSQGDNIYWNMFFFYNINCQYIK